MAVSIFLALKYSIKRCPIQQLHRCAPPPFSGAYFIPFKAGLRRTERNFFRITKEMQKCISPECCGGEERREEEAFLAGLSTGANPPPRSPIENSSERSHCLILKPSECDVWVLCADHLKNRHPCFPRF